MTTVQGARMRRYSRHLLIPEIGLAGQERLLHARVLVVGVGGLGSPVVQYLAAAGVGRIGLVDDDVVDLTNLQRQTLFATSDVGRPKVEVAAERIAAANPHVAVDVYPVRFAASNARALVRPYDVVVDATDTFAARYAVNDACRLEGKADVYGSIFRFDGQVSVFAPDGPCYRCLFPDPPPDGSVPTCAEGGVLGVLPGIVGAWQAAEALKLLLGVGRPLVGRLLLVDALDARCREIVLDRDPACALCGAAPTIVDVVEMERPPERATDVPALAPGDLDAWLGGNRDALILDVREPHETVLGVLAASVNVPASQLEARMHELDSAATYVVACRIGVKSAWAAQRLWDAGFRRIYHLDGGLLTYAAAGDAFDAF